MANPESPFARFWNVLTYSAFADYLDDPRTTSFTLAEYDRYPKGTGHFLAPRAWLREAIAGFDSHYADSRFMVRRHPPAARDRRPRPDPHLSRVRLGVPQPGGPAARSCVTPSTAGRPSTTALRARDPLAAGRVRGLPGQSGRSRAGRPPSPAGGRRDRGAERRSGGFALRRGRPVAEARAFGPLAAPFASAFTVDLARASWLRLRAAPVIAIVFGTTGELIKLAPVVHELQRRGHPPLMLSTGQQVTQLPGFAAELGLPAADLWLARGSGGHDLDRKREIPGWAARVAVCRHRGASAITSDGRHRA